MQLEKQAWEAHAEACRILEDTMLRLVRIGMLEWHFLMWFAENRRKSGAEADQLAAAIFEKAAKDFERVGQEAHDAGIVPDNPTELASDEDIQRELDETLPSLLATGADEAVVLRWLALWRKDASMDDKYEKVRPVFVQFARVVHAASEELEALWQELDESLGAEEEYEEEPERIELTPAARILNKNPKLLDGCTDFPQLAAKLNRTGRNKPCPCESGKKFKKCCGAPIIHKPHAPYP